jgi:hypothetical protein
VNEPSPDQSYPDILGAITGGARLNAGVVQLALATRPRIVRAGRAFEVLLLIQNASDAEIDLTATLLLPELDAKKQKGRFSASTNRLLIGLSPAEVGYAAFPVNCAADIAIAEGYRIGVGVEVKGEGKPKRIRPAEAAPTPLTGLTAIQMDAIAYLKKLAFSAARRGLLGGAVEVSFGVMGGQPGAVSSLPDKPNWIHLWGLESSAGIGELFNRYSDPLGKVVIARLTREKLYSPLFQTTREKISAGGFDLQPIEAHFITKLLTACLEMANPPEAVIDYLGGEHLNVMQWVKRSGSRPNEADLPHWCQAMLRLMAMDRRAVENPPRTLATTLYSDLLLDAIPHALEMVSKVTGEDLGDARDRLEYARQWVERVMQPKKEHKLTLTDAYLPLVMGGVIYYDRAIQKDEKVIDSLLEMARQLRLRRDESLDADHEVVFNLAQKVLDSAMQKYGYRA